VIRDRLHHEGGLTLVEILVAVAVVGVALVGLGIVIPVSSYGVQDASQLSTATFLAEQMMERVRSCLTAPPSIACFRRRRRTILIGTTCGGSSSRHPDDRRRQRPSAVPADGPDRGCAFAPG
jgi:prepilin-type N-terminal cleavage/methylation domain-containing protein